MTDHEIFIVKTTLRGGLNKWEKLCWESPTNGQIRDIISIGNPPIETDGDEPEPSECAYFSNGDYIALYNVELSSIFIRSPITF